MTDRYVDPDNGLDANPGTEGSPKKTINAMVAASSDNDTIYLMPGTYDSTTQGAGWDLDFFAGDPDNLTFNNYSTQVTLNAADGNRYIRPDNDKSYTFNSIKFAGTTALYFIQHTNATYDPTLTFNSCVFDNTGTAGGTRLLLAAGSPPDPPIGTFIFNNCTVTLAGNGATIWGVNKFHINGGTWTVNDALFLPNNTNGTLIVEEATITGVAATSDFIQVATDDVFSFIKVKNNTISMGNKGVTSHSFKSGDVYVGGNTITITGTGGGSWPIFFGNDYDDANAPSWADSTLYNAGAYVSHDDDQFECLETHTGPGDLSTEPKKALADNANRYWVRVQNNGKVLIENNTVSFTTAGNYHALSCMFGFGNATIRHNYVTGGDYQIVSKGRSNRIYGNVCYGASPMGIFAGEHNEIFNNTLWATSGTALVVGDQSDGNFSYGNLIYNNILIGDGAGIQCFSDDSDSADRKNYCDYNCYYQVQSGNIATLGGASRATLAALQTQWAAQSVIYSLNDANSISSDPLILDQANDIYSLKPNSPCLNTGKPSIISGFSSMGAWQRKSYLRYK